MAYYDGEILTPADSEKNSARDLALQIPPKVLDALYMQDESEYWVGQTSGEIRVEIQDTSGYSKIKSRMRYDSLPFEKESGRSRWDFDTSKAEETYVYQGNVLRVGETIIDALGINSSETNNVRWTVDTDNWRCVLTKVVK